MRSRHILPRHDILANEKLRRTESFDELPK